MPRPPVKRSKSNHQIQAAKRVPNNPLSNSPAARRCQLQDQLAHKQIGRVPSDSDDSDQLVTKTRNSRNRRGVPRQEIYCSGGVALNDKVAAHQSPSNKEQQLSSQQAPAVAAKGNGARSATAPARKGLKAIDSLSTSKPAEVPRPNAPGRANPSPLGLATFNVTQLQARGTPEPETSILGPIKMRKRQPSILRLIDSPDSPILEQDLDDFLPDDESTPLNASRKRKLSPTSTTSVPAPSTLSPPETGNLGGITGNATSMEPELPAAPSRNLLQNLQPIADADDDDDTMALPRSSSTAPSPIKAKAPSPIKNKASNCKLKKPQPLSTSALQALMPARRQQRPRRDRSIKATSEFDIPEDLSDVQNDSIAEGRSDLAVDDSYSASPRPAKKGRKQPPAKLLKKMKKSTNTIRRQDIKQSGTEMQETIGKRRTRKPSTQSPSVTRATSSSSAAKTSSQHQDHTRIDESNVAPRKTNSRSSKPALEDEGEAGPEDKENRPSSSFASSSERGRKNKPAGDPSPFADEEDEEIEIGRGGARAMSADGDEESRTEQARLAKKFKEVDEWEMEFEDVTFSEGSDPLAR